MEVRGLRRLANRQDLVCRMERPFWRLTQAIGDMFVSGWTGACVKTCGMKGYEGLIVKFVYRREKFVPRRKICD